MVTFSPDVWPFLSALSSGPLQPHSKLKGRRNSPIRSPVQNGFIPLNKGQQKQKDGEEGEFGGKKREKTDHRLSEHGVRWPRRIKFTISFTTNKSSSHNLKMKEKKKFSLRDTDLALPATAILGKPAPCFSS